MPLGSLSDDDFQPMFTSSHCRRRKLEQLGTPKRRDRSTGKKCRGSDAEIHAIASVESVIDHLARCEQQNGFSGLSDECQVLDEARAENAMVDPLSRISSPIDLGAEGPEISDDEISSLMTQVEKPAGGQQVAVSDEQAEPSLEELDVHCPVCEEEINSLSVQEREDHTNSCLDRSAELPEEAVLKDVSNAPVTDPVVMFLEKLDLSKFIPFFVEQEVDWDTFQCLTDEDLATVGVSTLGPRKKILVALQELKQETSCSKTQKLQGDTENCEPKIAPVKKYITDFFGGSSKIVKDLGSSKTKNVSKSSNAESNDQKSASKKSRWTQRTSELPRWKGVPGTRFRVDAFQYLTNDCSHWFLTHFHSDHYQGLTRGFRYGKIYCSLITARLVNLRIGVPWDRLHVLPMDERTSIDGVWVTLLDANHCPGAAMVLFEPAGGEAVLHTGDFRYCDAMTKIATLATTSIHTLVLDTTYCDPQYDFPKQEAVIQFVIDAIQAESFNPNTLFLIGTYTLGKERLFFEVARVLKRKIYVGALKRRMLACLELSEEDMSWITTNDHESCIHVVPLWSIASFKRMASISRHYNGKFDTIVSFSPTGWSMGKGRKRTPGKRWQQGTIVRYEVPYSEHSSFTELKSFVKFIEAETIIPSVNNSSREAALSMVKCLTN